MKFTDAYEALTNGRDLVFDGEQRVSIVDKRPSCFVVQLEDGVHHGLDWLHREARRCEPAPRKLPALPDGYRWIISANAARPVAIWKGDALVEEVAETVPTCAGFRREAGRHETLAAVYRALVAEYETR